MIFKIIYNFFPYNNLLLKMTTLKVNRTNFENQFFLIKWLKW